ncbi:MAG: branched-chain amino acid ABC transporter substrate-binding protein, partial [Candidatus Eremiobacteraeota bacterium]|nr:branched-chain amino acid ABC transporter substrate-binding protein [Candidatus Eremiobacteraeota bacterium]
MRHTSGFARFAIATFAGIVLASCSSPSSTSQSSSGTSAPGGSGGTIKIGIDLPVSGADASTGIPTRNGAIQAIEEANAKGVPGGFKFFAYDLDDAVQGAHDPAQGAQNVKAFVSDSAVVAMVGPVNSSVAKAQIPITNDAGLVQISPANTSTGLTKGDDAKKLRTSHPDVNTYFRVCTTDDRQGAAGAQFAKKLGYKKAFIVDDNETYGKGLADVFEAQFKAGGGTVVGHEHLTKGQTDYKALLTKAKALAPDMVFYGGTTATGGGLLRKQMADAGLAKTAYVGGDGISDAEFLKTAGDMANGAYYTVAAPETSKLPSATAFVAAYRKRWNTDVGPYSANAYAAANVEIAAAEKALAANGNAMPTRADVLKNVAATKNFASPIGPIGFDPNGDTTNPILSLYKIAGGKAV